MKDMIVKRIPVGTLNTNCYIVKNPDTRDAIVIDPGSQGGEIARRLAGDNVTHIVATHCHGDHIHRADQDRTRQRRGGKRAGFLPYHVLSPLLRRYGHTAPCIMCYYTTMAFIFQLSRKIPALRFGLWGLDV